MRVHASSNPVMECPHLLVLSVYAVGMGFVFSLCRVLRLVLLQVHISFLVRYACISSQMPAESLLFLGISVLGSPLVLILNGMQ